MQALDADPDAVHMEYNGSIEAMQELSIVGALSQCHWKELTSNIVGSLHFHLCFECI
jgi:hypothetical protein